MSKSYCDADQSGLRSPTSLSCDFVLLSYRSDQLTSFTSAVLTRYGLGINDHQLINL